MAGEGSKGVSGKIYNTKEALTFNTNVPTHFSPLTTTEDVCLPTTSLWVQDVIISQSSSKNYSSDHHGKRWI